jgi:hypothetical protein
MSRKPDKFMQDMGRIRRARRRRRAQQEKERLLDEEAPLLQEKWQDFQDGLEFRAQEFGALGREVARGVTRELGNLGKGVLKGGANLAVDFVASAVTLGLAQPSSPFSRRSRQRRRR